MTDTSAAFSSEYSSGIATDVPSSSEAKTTLPDMLDAKNETSTKADDSAFGYAINKPRRVIIRARLING